mgnify:CR=1 FL=1
MQLVALIFISLGVLAEILHLAGFTLQLCDFLATLLQIGLQSCHLLLVPIVLLLDKLVATVIRLLRQFLLLLLKHLLAYLQGVDLLLQLLVLPI